MKGENLETPRRKANGRSGFQIAGSHVVSKRSGTPAPAEHLSLPTTYGAPILFAIPRDPRTIFTYWNIDWSDVFARRAPSDRQVYLRVKRGDGSDEIEEPIEPMLGSHFTLVSQPKGSYQVELGFYGPQDAWNSIAASDRITMPAETSSQNADIDIATVPFHLSFQRMIDLFRAEKGDAITSLLSQLQNRAESERDSELSEEEREILDAMDLSLDDLRGARSNFARSALDELLRKRAEALLGFGAPGTSPSGGPGGPGGLGGSSWSSGL